MNLNLSVCSIRSVLSGLISLPPPRLWPSYACQNVASWRDTRSDAQNNIKIKLCTYLSKPILKHRSHAKSSHNIYKKKTNNNMWDMCFVSFICDTSHRGTGIQLLHKTAIVFN